LCRKEDEKVQKRIRGEYKKTVSGAGPEVNPIPNSIGLTFGEKAVGMQGPEGSPLLLLEQGTNRGQILGIENRGDEKDENRQDDGNSSASHQ